MDVSSDSSSLQRAVVFDWAQTLALIDIYFGAATYTPVTGAREQVRALRERGIDVFIASGGYYDEQMTHIGVGRSDFIHCDPGHKGYAIDVLRTKGYEHIVYVGDTASDITGPALKGVPTILFNHRANNRGNNLTVETYEEEKSKILGYQNDADIQIAFGFNELDLAIALALERSHHPQFNRTIVGPFATIETIQDATNRLMEQLQQISTIPIVDPVGRRISHQNIPSNSFVEFSILTENATSPHKSFRIQIDYPLEIPERTILDAIDSVIAPPGRVTHAPHGYIRSTRVPDSIRATYNTIGL